VALDDIYGGPGHRKLLEVRDPVGLQTAVEESIALSRDALLELGEDQRMTPIETDRGTLR
jgi:hypothetical protein